MISCIFSHLLHSNRWSHYLLWFLMFVSFFISVLPLWLPDLLTVLTTRLSYQTCHDHNPYGNNSFTVTQNPSMIFYEKRGILFLITLHWKNGLLLLSAAKLNHLMSWSVNIALICKKKWIGSTTWKSNQNWLYWEMFQVAFYILVTTSIFCL